MAPPYTGSKVTSAASLVTLVVVPTAVDFDELIGTRFGLLREQYYTLYNEPVSARLVDT